MGAIRHTQTATSDAPWDDTMQEQRMGGRKRTPGQLGAAYAWVDPTADATSRTSYRYLHHLVDTSGAIGAASTHACLAGIAKLNGARGVDIGIPDGDRVLVYQHLARHLTDAGMNAPKLRTPDPEIDFAPTIERRFTLVPVECRARQDGKKVIAGYAAVFDKPSHNLGGFIERVAPSFFNEARMGGWQDVLARFNHKDDLLLGTTAARTLRLEIDGNGLGYEIDPPNSRADVVELIERGDVRQSSFAFRQAKDEWTLSEEGYPLRILHSGEIMDVAPVTRAAYPDTTSAIRSLADQMGADPREIQHMMAADELRSLWVRSKGNAPAPARQEPKRAFGPAALIMLDQKRDAPGDS